MLTITTNQNMPNFKSRNVMAKSSEKLGNYFKTKGINPNKVLITSALSTAGTGTAILASPELISAPKAAKWIVGGAMAGVLSLMALFGFKKHDANTKNEFQETNFGNVKINQFIVNDAENPDLINRLDKILPALKKSRNAKGTGTDEIIELLTALRDKNGHIQPVGVEMLKQIFANENNEPIYQLQNLVLPLKDKNGIIQQNAAEFQAEVYKHFFENNGQVSNMDLMPQLLKFVQNKDGSFNDNTLKEALSLIKTSGDVKVTLGAMGGKDIIEMHAKKNCPKHIAPKHIDINLKRLLKEYCLMHYECEELPCVVGAMGGISSICSIFPFDIYGNPTLGTYMLTIGAGAMVYEVLMYAIGSYEHSKQKRNHW